MFLSSASLCFWLLIAAFGLVVGSFLNLCIVRIPENESIVFPGSHCRFCGGPIGWKDKIPLLSYLFLKGHCRFCSKKIPISYVLVEILSAILLLLTVFKYQQSFLLEDVSQAFSALWRGIFGFVAFVAPLVVIFVIDWRFQIIPNRITLPFILVGFLSNLVLRSFSFDSIVFSFLGSFIGFGILGSVAFFYKRLKGIEGMGRGDLKLAAMLGAFLGWQGILWVIFLSSVFGTIFGLSQMFFIGFRRRLEIPYGPFLALGAWVYWFAELFFEKTII